MTPPPADPWFRPHTAYVHVPFCAHHCGYCDFAVTTAAGPLVELYLDALAAELAGLGDPFPVETRFIGGGTPTRLTPDQLARLLALLTRWLPAPPGSEFSIEANPDDVTPELVAVLAAGGVTRVSLGVQSFRPASLAALNLILALVLTGFVGLATMLAGVCLVAVVWLRTPEDLSFLLFCIATAGFIIFTHRGNISRMLQGTEHRARRVWLLRPRSS